MIISECSTCMYWGASSKINLYNISEKTLNRGRCNNIITDAFSSPFVLFLSGGCVVGVFVVGTRPHPTGGGGSGIVAHLNLFRH